MNFMVILSRVPAVPGRVFRVSQRFPVHSWVGVLLLPASFSFVSSLFTRILKHAGIEFLNPTIA